ncbi:hypothetical protein, partial [Pseudomonas savastanoi]|uniref:hypothetical protein n=4 Tax=Pseudomonas syringae group TaxID=136849 RepID=UPI0005772C1C
SIPRLCGGILQPNAEVSTLNLESRQMSSRLCTFANDAAFFAPQCESADQAAMKGCQWQGMRRYF